MIGSKRFFRSFWPWAGPAITEHYADTSREVRGLLRLVRLRPRAHILDVPCGYGRHALELARRGRQVRRGTVSLRLYSVHELVRLLKQARFSAVRVWGDWDRRPVAFNSRRLVIVARR